MSPLVNLVTPRSVPRGQKRSHLTSSGEKWGRWQMGEGPLPDPHSLPLFCILETALGTTCGKPLRWICPSGALERS